MKIKDKIYTKKWRCHAEVRIFISITHHVSQQITSKIALKSTRVDVVKMSKVFSVCIKDVLNRADVIFLIIGTTVLKRTKTLPSVTIAIL
jgi:hypothetical protein